MSKALPSLSTASKFIISRPLHQSPIQFQFRKGHLFQSSPITTTTTTTNPNAKMPARATIAGHVIASADTYETVEGNVYFPPSSISDKSILSSSSLTTVCPWKGTASYYTLNVDGKTYKDAAWYYPEPKDKASNIKDHIAFCKFPAPFPFCLPGGENWDVGGMRLSERESGETIGDRIEKIRR